MNMKIKHAHEAGAVGAGVSPGLAARALDGVEPNEKILGFVLLTPAMLLILVFIAYPFVLGIWMSLTDKLVGTPGQFIGLGNYMKLLF